MSRDFVGAATQAAKVQERVKDVTEKTTASIKSGYQSAVDAIEAFIIHPSSVSATSLGLRGDGSLAIK